MIKEKYIWSVYQVIDSDKTAFISVNSGIAKNLNDLPFEQMLEITVHIKSKMEDRLPTAEEFIDLDKIEEELDQRLQEGGASVGRLTINGLRCFYYYGNFNYKDLEILINEIKIKSMYDIEFRLKKDQNRDFYWDFLYPSEEEWQMISNQGVLRNISKYGDTLTAPRKIDHTIIFVDKENCHEFVKWASQNRYTIEEEVELDDEEEEDNIPIKYRVTISHEVIPTREKIDDITLSLYWKAKEYDGIYDGWGSLVIVDSDEKEGSRQE